MKASTTLHKGDEEETLPPPFSLPSNLSYLYSFFSFSCHQPFHSFHRRYRQDYSPNGRLIAEGSAAVVKVVAMMVMAAEVEVAAAAAVVVVVVVVKVVGRKSLLQRRWFKK